MKDVKGLLEMARPAEDADIRGRHVVSVEVLVHLLLYTQLYGKAFVLFVEGMYIVQLLRVLRPICDLFVTCEHRAVCAHVGHKPSSF